MLGNVKEQSGASYSISIAFSVSFLTLQLKINCNSLKFLTTLQKDAIIVKPDVNVNVPFHCCKALSPLSLISSTASNSSTLRFSNSSPSTG